MKILEKILEKYHRDIINKLTSLIISKSLLSTFVNMTQSTPSKTTLQTLNFDNLVLRTLPIDPITENYVRQVKNAMFSRVFENLFFQLLIKKILNY